ncbi:MAG: FmdE family protein [bacterium]
MAQQNDKMKVQSEKTMGGNGHLLSQLEVAGKLHGHICPSLFYGVSLAMRINEWMQTTNPVNRAAFEIILEGKSGCIRDGVRSVLGEGTAFTIQNTGHCALTAVCTKDQQRCRISISPAVRKAINELNQSLPLEEFKQVGVAHLKSLLPQELFEE